MDRDGLIAAIEAGEAFEFLPFYGHAVRSPVGSECLSQWYPHPFEADGVPYRTAEHYMMAGKARVFDDAEMLQRILDSETPREAKALGRKVRGFDGDVWAAHRVAIVTDGNVAKFAEPALHAFLRSTGDRVLVEAAPRDRIWGVGLGKNNPAVTDPRQWRGLNLLGFALMEARARLR